MKFFKVNGWQRLWVVASLVWLVCVFFLSINEVIPIVVFLMMWIMPSVGVYLLGLGVARI